MEDIRDMGKTHHGAAKPAEGAGAADGGKQGNAGQPGAPGVSGSKRKKKKKGRNRNRYTGWRARYGDFWKPGMPLTHQDEEMLRVVRWAYERQGYSPTKREVPNSPGLKKRFRLWKDVLLACGYPPVGDPEEMRKRRKAARWKQRMKDIMSRTDSGRPE